MTTSQRIKKSLKIRRACVSGGYHAFQFACRVMMGLLAILIVFGVIWGMNWQRYE